MRMERTYEKEKGTGKYDSIRKAAFQMGHTLAKAGAAPLFILRNLPRRKIPAVKAECWAGLATGVLVSALDEVECVLSRHEPDSHLRSLAANY